MNKFVVTILAVIVICIAIAVYWYIDSETKDVEALGLLPNDSKIVSLGKATYADNCAACHGSNLEGQPNWKQRTANGRMPAPPHDESGHTWHHADALLIEITKRGPAAIVGGDYESDMPAYEDILSHEEIIAALSFIKSTWPPHIQVRHDSMNQR